MVDRLKSKVALVTGGGTGIGKSIALKFSHEGANVAISGRTAASLHQTVKQITDEGGQAIHICGDVSKDTDAQLMVAETVNAFGRLDILVNNAGVRSSIGTIEQLSEEEWDKTFDIDVKGTWLCSKHAIAEMRKSGGGSIIMITSISAHIGQPRQGAYNAAKAAQELLMKSMALDFSAENIRCNAICPGWVETEMNREQLAEMRASPNKHFPPGLSYNDLVMKLHPLGRIGQPDDCAWAAIYLGSDESQWVTGTSLFVDGGYCCQ
jgi:NAD(P)-dependent dehydrogenase (short-subunit alcohol dehydrogenase family)